MVSTVNIIRWLRHNPYFNRWFSAIRDKKAFKRFLRKVTILILIDGFLQSKLSKSCDPLLVVTILILIDGFLQFKNNSKKSKDNKEVTILILIDGFLQYGLTKVKLQTEVGHNPYFNRWFSAI